MIFPKSSPGDLSIPHVFSDISELRGSQTINKHVFNIYTSRAKRRNLLELFPMTFKTLNLGGKFFTSNIMGISDHLRSDNDMHKFRWDVDFYRNSG